MIFNMAGGGASLNFAVTGGTSTPDSPRLNTIWVETSVPLTGWYISPAEPENPWEGLVWIHAGNQGPVSFSAVRNNTLLILPGMVKQYVSGSWEKRSASIWQNGWLPLAADLVIYDGTIRVPLTLNRVTQREGYLDAAIPISGKGGATIQTASPIDLTPYSVFQAEYTGLTGGTASSKAYGRLDLLTEDGEVAGETQYTDAAGTMTLDISALTGEYTPEVQFHNASASTAREARVTAIRLLV